MWAFIFSEVAANLLGVCTDASVSSVPFTLIYEFGVSAALHMSAALSRVKAVSLNSLSFMCTSDMVNTSLSQIISFSLTPNLQLLDFCRSSLTNLSTPSPSGSG